jgi:hypothetical protein
LVGWLARTEPVGPLVRGADIGHVEVDAGGEGQAAAKRGDAADLPAAEALVGAEQGQVIRGSWRRTGGGMS